MNDKDLKPILDEFKKLPFIKSWQNAHVSKVHRILDRNTGVVSERELQDFLYIPGPNLVRHYGSNPKFLAFRGEHESGRDWDYKLVPDKFENDNRRLAVFYIAKLMEPLHIHFMVDAGYGIFIEIQELASLALKGNPLHKELYLHFSIPKTIGKKNGAIEEWGA